MSYNEQLRCDNLTTNYEGAQAWRMTPEWELYSTVATTMGVEDKFYERGEDRVRRIADLVRKVKPEYVAQLAVYAREMMHLRSVPLLLLTELAQCHHGDSLVSRAVAKTVQRADEITELLMCYQWRTGKKDLTGLSNQLRKGLAEAFNHFDEYQFAKYNRTDREVTLRDALLLVHPKPKDERQKELFRKILNDDLETPYTWETELSRTGQQHFNSFKEKKEAVKKVWQELIASRRMGYMATLRNLRNMLEASIDDTSLEQVCAYLSNPEAVKNSKQLPFRYLSAYMQFQQLVDVSKLPLAAEIKWISKRCQRLENAINARKKGKFPAKVRRVVRFILRKEFSENSIAENAVIHGKLEWESPKQHFRRRFIERKRYEHLTDKQLRTIQHMENVLSGLRRREKTLMQKQASYAEESQRVKMLRQIESLLPALEQAASFSAVNIPGFDKDTRVLLASDTSGSMCRPISGNSSVMCYHIGLLLSMLMKHRCPQAVTGMFGDIWKTFDMPSENILQSTIDMMSREGEVGYATNGYKVIDWLIKEKKVMDKVMLFTDCQLWDSCWHGDSLHESWNRYKQIAPDARLYIFDLAGYGQSPISMERDDVFCIAGWSDKVFDILAALERGNSAIDEIRRIVV